MAEIHQHLGWLSEHTSSALAHILGAMTDQAPAVTADFTQGALAVGALPSQEGFFWWEESFVGAENASLWFGCPREAWWEIGRRTLQAAGLTDVTEADAKNTFLETLNQWVGELNTAVQRRGIAEFLRGQGREVEADPANDHVISYAIRYPDADAFHLFLVVSPEFLNMLQQPAQATPKVEVPATIPRQEAGPSNSRTLELLMEVELPVSVSFGRTHLPLKDVLKLSSGAIVELNRSVSEPVELIVNNCVIARGEVVVIDGNYGVRINQIVSVQERLRTLH